MFKYRFMPMFSADGGQGAGGADNSTDPETKVDPNTNTKDETKADAMIPKTRFDEINQKYKEMAGKVAEFEKAQAQAKADAEAKELAAKKEQGKYEELYLNSQKELDTYKAYETRTQELEGLIQGMVTTKLEAVPKEMVDLVPTNLTVEQTLDWLNKAESKGLFGKQETKEIGKPANQTNQAPKVDKSNMSTLEKIIAGLGK